MIPADSFNRGMVGKGDVVQDEDRNQSSEVETLIQTSLLTLSK